MPLTVFGMQRSANDSNLDDSRLIGSFSALPRNQSEGCCYRINKFSGFDGAILVVHQNTTRSVLLWFLAPSEPALRGHVPTIRQMVGKPARITCFGDNWLLPLTLWTVRGG